MSLKKFQKWIKTCPLKNWVELHNDKQFIVIQFNKEINDLKEQKRLEYQRAVSIWISYQNTWQRLKTAQRN